ncbi:hypothetical protein OKA04_06350 [Luteolibacter flavescens]|uniref:Arginine N-succinyltransferase n=1 Tax=Luteolibacter flavescens TaxID=1859460 RepID=A0ABT3FLA6_9BACT|nr:hypothetical protein [Luteolibacter flavescens]MCW1884345.1 hypothetical protein [Luteolibacter flavescens]
MSESSPPPIPRKKSCLVPVLIGIIAVLLVGIGLVWWTNRPIKPVQLSAEEKAVVQQKVEAIQQVEGPAEPTYEKGKKEIVLTERELNGLLNEHTTLGEKLKLELATDAVHARYEADLDPDMPVVGGKKLKARARFIVKTTEGIPSLVLDDFTLWGVSLPNDWLGQLKGKDILGEILGAKGGKVAGIEEMKVSSGELTIKLKE